MAQPPDASTAGNTGADDGTDHTPVDDPTATPPAPTVSGAPGAGAPGAGAPGAGEPGAGEPAPAAAEPRPINAPAEPAAAPTPAALKATTGPPDASDAHADATDTHPIHGLAADRVAPDAGTPDASATGASTTGASATGASTNDPSATGASATRASATGASATGANANDRGATGANADDPGAADPEATGGSTAGYTPAEATAADGTFAEGSAARPTFADDSAADNSATAGPAVAGTGPAPGTGWAGADRTEPFGAGSPAAPTAYLPPVPQSPYPAWSSPGSPAAGPTSPPTQQFGYPGGAYPQQPYDPAAIPPPGAPDAPVWPATPHQQQPKKRTALWVSLAVVLALVLCGGGGVSAYLLLRNAESSDGAPDPGTAVVRFLTAVYTDKDAAAAADLVCSEARDEKKITAKVDEVKGYSTTYKKPQFAWNTPTVSDEQKEKAVVSVKLTMTTEDEKTSEQELTFTTIKKTGWWVCEVSG